MFGYKKFPFFFQLDAMDCGPTCLRMIAAYYGKHFTLQSLRSQSYLTRNGVSLLGISNAAENIGLRTLVANIPFEGNAASLMAAPLPCIAHWNQRHFIVVYKVNRKYVWVADPSKGKMRLLRHHFESGWLQRNNTGIVMLLEPSPNFYALKGEKQSYTDIWFLGKYVRPFRKYFVHLILGLMLGVSFPLLFPFLTQSIVDIGIQHHDLEFIYLILIAQLVLFFSQAMVGALQNWILIFIGARVNIALVNDFLIKLMKLPISFFDAKMTGDIIHRITDQRRIELFLTNSVLQIVFSALTITVFSLVLLSFNLLIFTVFIIGSSLYLFWIFLLMRRRREIDHLTFQHQTENQHMLLEMVQGMQEIKLQGSGKKRRWKWTHLQSRLFDVNMKSLAIAQAQDTGASMINQIKNIVISVMAATAVSDGRMSLGTMLAIQYINGQLNVPLLQIMGIIRTGQDARISLERLGEINSLNEEDSSEQNHEHPLSDADLVLENVHFRYNPLENEVLSGINLRIPNNKVTAIVGQSGSGKTTLIKLLLGFYSPQSGKIKVGEQSLESLSKDFWRQHCGAVMQDGYIFSDTIANNISESDSEVNLSNLWNAINLANIRNFIESLPMGLNTMIGSKGNGISQGQRQRILIARAIYKNPKFIFLDEATNALDANNERTIVESLNQFFNGKTVVVVAHRLSTVKNADQIVVLENGKIIEIGNHKELIEQKNVYFHLVKNQLDLDE